MKMTALMRSRSSRQSSAFCCSAPPSKHFRDLHRMTHPPASMIATPKEKLARPLYVSDKRR
jgi:hypothetical protein